MRASAFKGDSQVAGAMQAYRVKGTAPFGKQTQVFSQDVIASNNNDAKPRVFSILGSRHKLNRNQINIESCKKISPDSSSDPLVINHFREQITVSDAVDSEEE